MLLLADWRTQFRAERDSDNLTTTIVMISLIRKLITQSRDRLVFAGIIVIAANAGGAWSPT